MPTSEKQVRVSYIITTRNRAEFLDRTLRNLGEFITDEDELIIMDGASTDHTTEVVKKHQDIVTLFISEPDCGEAHGYNKGVLKSRGRYIKLITDDDYFYPDAMRQAIAVMECHPEIDALMTGGEAFELDPVSRQERLVTYLHLPPSRQLTDNINNILTYVQCGLGLILTLRIISRVGLFDTSFRAVDTDYMGRLIAHKTEFRYLDVKLFRHIAHAGSGQNNGPECQRDRIRTLLRNQAWTDLFNEGIYPLSAVAGVFGLERLPGAEYLIQLICVGEQVRRHKAGRTLLSVIAQLVRITKQLLRLLWKIDGRTFPSQTTKPLANPTSLMIEPVWDGMLR